MKRLSEWIRFRHAAVVWMVAIGVALSLAISFYLRKAEDDVIRLNFERIVADRVSALEREIESELKKLISLKAFYAGSDKINRPEFEAYAKTFG
ncbi:MAG: hypothetical protein PHW17_13255, partial [Desulfobacterales bacterium]|nr:hypothetical protein [Desulfobacterales bacterium]